MKKSFLFLGVCMAIIMFTNCSSKNKKSDSISERINDSINERINDSISIIEIPDTNFKAYLLGNFDENKDGNISFLEAKAVKEINCSGKGIENIAGIEKFTNITLLDCSNNKLEELDIRYNKKLKKLICNDNIPEMWIYVPMSGLLRNQNIPKPKPNEEPNQAVMGMKPLDLNKCTFDEDITSVSLIINE